MTEQQIQISHWVFFQLPSFKKSILIRVFSARNATVLNKKRVCVVFFLKDYLLPKDPDMSWEGDYPYISLYSYSGDGIETINPILGRGLDP